MFSCTTTKALCMSKWRNWTFMCQRKCHWSKICKLWKTGKFIHNTFIHFSNKIAICSNLVTQWELIIIRNTLMYFAAFIWLYLSHQLERFPRAAWLPEQTTFIESDERPLWWKVILQGKLRVKYVLLRFSSTFMTMYTPERNPLLYVC